MALAEVTLVATVKVTSRIGKRINSFMIQR